MTVSVDRAVPYGHGKLLDIYRPASGGPAPMVLLWHGIGPDERDVLEPLARAVAGFGAVVVVPDWRSDAADRGSAQLLASIAFTLQRAADLGADPGTIVLAGWSMGGRAAAGVALNPEAVGGWRPSAVACLGSGFTTPAPTTGTVPLDDLASTNVAPVPFWLVHGTEDPVVPVARSVGFAAALASHDWPARLAQAATDHAGVVMAEYDPQIGRCRPATAGPALAAGQLTARLLAVAAGLGQGQAGASERPRRQEGAPGRQVGCLP